MKKEDDDQCYKCGATRTLEKQPDFGDNYLKIICAKCQAFIRFKKIDKNGRLSKGHDSMK